jgi:protein TonB
MRSSVVGSSVVHMAILIVLLWVRTVPPLVVPGPDVVQVALIDPALSAIQRPPPPVEKPTPAREEIKPTEDTGVKLAPPKPPKKKPTVKPKEEPPTPPTAAALPYAPVGNAGLKGQITLDASDFEFTYYLLLVRNRIAQNWTPPAGMVSSGQPVHAVVYFRIGRGGDLSGIRVETPSGADFFDRSAQRAVSISDPMPPLPLGYSGGDLGVHFGFEYSGP